MPFITKATVMSGTEIDLFARVRSRIVGASKDSREYSPDDFARGAPITFSLAISGFAGYARNLAG